MRLLAIASIPIALVALWAAWRAASGRPVRRFALNAVFASLLLAYFAITAGLGIFWVANQELPVFDPHYLFGYLTLVLVVIHVIINGPLLARFVRKRSAALSASGQVWRPSVAWIGRAVALVAFGVLCFWIGFSRGINDVRIERGDPVERPSADDRTRRGMAEQLVDGDGGRQPLSRWYNEHSKLSRTGAVVRGPSLDVSTRAEPFETYPSEAIVALPSPAPATPTTGEALDATHTAPASIGAAPVSLQQLSGLLHLMQGITSITGLPTDPFHRRAAASSGALYPTVTHVVAADVKGLPAGLYHYEPRTHALHRLRSGDVRDELAKTVAHPHAVTTAPFTVVLSAIYYKSSWKYQERAYRYCLLDAGHVAANALAAVHTLGLAARSIARFDDAALGTLLALDAHRQGPLLVVPIGAPRELATSDEPAFEPVDLRLASEQVPAPVMLVASRTALRITDRRVAPFEPLAPIRPRSPATPIPLPAPVADTAALTEVIERRRSERRFSDATISAAQLGTILRRARGASVEDQRALRMHVFALRIDGLASGAYEVHDDGTLSLVRAGDLANDVHAVALSQEVAGNAAAVVALSVDATRMAWPDASRGYRYGWLDAGITGGRMYLMAVALGLGVSSIGAFFDDDLAALVKLDPSDTYPALLVALGAKN